MEFSYVTGFLPKLNELMQTKWLLEISKHTINVSNNKNVINNNNNNSVSYMCC